MTYVIGDLHGNADELKRLVSLLPVSAGDAFVFLGDYLDKNPQTQETLAALCDIESGHPCTFLMGNHEFVWDRYVNGGDASRRDFLLRFGGVDALRSLVSDPTGVLMDDDVGRLKEVLAPYLDLISRCRPYAVIGEYLAIHAGVKPEQLDQDPLRVEEEDYFIRPDGMDLDRKYLGRFRIVAGHTYLGDEPTVRDGYLNIDLGAGYGRSLGALHVERNMVIRSDGKTFPVAPVS
jgi:hypothetical protein